MRFPQLFVNVVIVGLVALLAASESFGQAQHQAGERGFNPGKSYSISDIETIGLYSGNVMLNMPLGSLPSGRGGMSAGIALNYNSKIWDMFVTDVTRFTTTHDMKSLVPSPEGGWKYNYRYYLKLDYRHLGMGNGMCTVNVEDSYTTIKIQLISPDGAQHLMLPGNTGAIGTDDFSNVYPDGRLQCDPVAVTSGQIKTFYSKDNSFLRLEVLTDSDTNWENNTWTLYMPDGSKVAYDPNSTTRQTITDRNGNYVQIIENATDISYSNHQTTYLKDQFDRKVVIEYAAATNEDRIHSKGFGGATLTTRVTWKDIIVNKTYFACEMAPSPLDQNAFENYTLNESFRVVDKIYLPTQIEGDLFYEFGYNADGTTGGDDGWGEIVQVTTPSGAVSDYEYYYDGVSGSGINAEKVLANRPTEKNLTYDLEYDGGSTGTTDTWVYTAVAPNGDLTGLTSVKVITPAGSETTEYYTPEYDKKGEVYKTVMPDGSTVEKLYQSNSATGIGALPNRFVSYEFTSIADSSGTPVKTAIKEYTQDKNGNMTSVKEYDYFSYSAVPRTDGKPTGLPSGASSNLKRISVTEFYNPVPDSASTTYNDADSYHLASSERLLRLAKATEIQDGSATPKSRSEVTYDYTNYDSSNTKAGNPTETKVWDSFKGGSLQSYSNPLTGTNSITTSATYNAYGMPLTSTDANGNVTSITYGNVTCPGGTVTDLYATLTAAADGSAVERTSSAVYDCYTGLTTSSTDEDNDLTNSVEYDDLGRPVKSITADGTNLESWTVTEYHDEDRFVVVKSDLEAVGDGKKVATQFYDQLGRVRLSKTLENAATQSAVNETDGIKVQTRYMTGGAYSYQLSSNPYRANYSYNETEPTMGWTRSKTINTGRHSEVETFSGATLPQPFLTSGYNTNATGLVQTDTDANATTVTDQAGKMRRSITNALGQLIRVDEPNSSNQLGTITSPNQATEYTYDILNNLILVDQGEQEREFSYSSLSRLLSAESPESGTITYEYDANGNLVEKTDARTITTTYTYDALNRVTFRNYSETTPDVTYTYGTTAPAIGKLIKVESGISTTEYTSFDILGRVTAHKQTTDGTNYTTGYLYNLSGALIEQTYPSGRVVKNVLDNDGDLSLVQSKKNANHGYWNYANSLTYNAAGAVTSLQLGNGRWESTTFNSRLQPTQIALGTVQNGTDKMDLEFGYGTIANNGNVLSQTITVPTVGVNNGFTAVQTYTYDSLNRIKDATENVTPHGSSSSQSWNQSFIYDRYGNRNFDQANTTQPASFADPDVTNPTVSTTNNRFASGQGYSYDSSGNTTQDALGRTFVYDAENKQVEVIENSVTIGEYFYDGDAKRIKKVSANETVIFVYDATGKLVAEYANQISQTPKVSYLTNDHLGSPRINTDENGAVIARHDYHPFGEEIIGTGGRTTGLCYAADDVRKQFTGYERDTETDLDFAEARMYAKTLGRFTVVDPINMKSNRLGDPQALNLYVYTRNNPLMYVDPDGKEFVDEDGNSITVEVVDGKLKVSCKACKKGSKQLASLSKLAFYVNEAGSSKAFRKFMALNNSEGKIHVVIDRNTGIGTGGLHQPYGTSSDGTRGPFDPTDDKYTGKPDIRTDKNGNDIYSEALFTFDEGELENTFGDAREKWGDMSFGDYLALTFNHEALHNLDPEQVQFTKNGSKGADYHKNSWENTKMFVEELNKHKTFFQNENRFNQGQLRFNRGQLVPNF